MTDDEPEKKKITIAERVTTIENRLWGDQAAILRYKKAVAGYVTPRGQEPPQGELVLLVRTVDGLLGRFEELEKENRRLRGFLQPVDISRAPLDGQVIATQGFVDAATQRLSNALREEFKRGGADSRTLDALLTKVDALEYGVRELAGFLASMMPKKIRKRIIEGLYRWYGSEKGEWILKALANRLDVPEARR